MSGDPTINLVTNGSFEDGEYDNFQNVTNSNGWKSDGVFQYFNNTHLDASDGNTYIEVDSESNSNVYQDLSTEVGHTYTFTFDYSPRPGISADSNVIEVYWDGNLIDTITGDSSGWISKTYELTATTDTTRIEFKASGTSDGFGGFVDNIAVHWKSDPVDMTIETPIHTIVGDLGTGEGGLIGSIFDTVEEVTGLDLNDTITGTVDSDLIYGLEGDDDITAGLGSDTVWGWTENDTIRGGDGNDLISGDAGNDIVYGDAGNDSVFGDTGDDQVHGGDGVDVVGGGDGNDQLFGDAGNDLMYGDAGTDILKGGTGDDYMEGGTGNDTLEGEAGHDALVGGAGNDILYGDSASHTTTSIFHTDFEPGSKGFVDTRNDWNTTSDKIEVRKGLGADGDEFIELSEDPGNNKPDSSNIYRDVATEAGKMYELTFNYSPRAGFNADVNEMTVTIDGDVYHVAAEDGTGNGDNVWQEITINFEGTGGTQRIMFEATGTVLKHGIGPRLDAITLESSDGGHDSLLGGDGDDTLDGGVGHDYLEGGDGADILTSGSGFDEFVYTNLSQSTATSRDTITDFTKGHDVIKLAGLGFTSIQSGAAAGDVLGYTHVGGDTIISADGSDFSIKLTGELDLEDGDFTF